MQGLKKANPMLETNLFSSFPNMYPVPFAICDSAWDIRLAFAGQAMSCQTRFQLSTDDCRHSWPQAGAAKHEGFAHAQDRTVRSLPVGLPSSQPLELKLDHVCAMQQTGCL